MIYIFHAILVAVLFLIMLNGFLEGAKKAQIDAIMSIIVICLWVIGFVAFGWEMGVAALVLSPIYGMITRPLAAPVAVRLMAGSAPSKYRGLPDSFLRRISKNLDRGHLFDGGQAIDDLLDYCTVKPEIIEVMRSFNLDRTDLVEYYEVLCRAGAGQWAVGHWVPASALADPNSLHFLAKRFEAGQAGSHNIDEAAYALIMYFGRGAPLPEA